MPLPVLAALAGGAMLGQGLFGLFGASSARKARKKAQQAERTRMEAALEILGRHREGFLEESERSRQGLTQSFAGRGLSESSIREQGLQRQARQVTRRLEDYAARERSAWAAFEAFRYGVKAQDYQEILGIGQNILTAGIGAVSMFGGGGGGVGAGAAGGVPPTSWMPW